MLAVFCPRHGTRVLLSERRIRALRNTDHGILIEVECYDGERIVLRTGRRASRTATEVTEESSWRRCS